MRSRTWKRVLLFIFTAVINRALLCAGSSVLWQIGVFDDSSHEFNLGIDPETGRPTAHPIDYTDPAENPVFVVGKSNPADWYAYQPGTSNGKAGFRAHPFTIQFDLLEKPEGLFTLELSVLHYSPRLPRLEVNVNGHRGLFYQHPILNYSRGDVANLFIPHYSKAMITCDLPTSFLQRGNNKLVFGRTPSAFSSISPRSPRGSLPLSYLCWIIALACPASR